MNSFASQTTTNCALERKSSFYILNRFWFYGILAIGMLAITFLAYKPVLFNFFFMDDFSFLVWLKEATKNPSLLLQPFFHHYMNEPYYYRPLITMFWAIEYFIWGVNGLCFHICSIVGMFLTSLVLALIVVEFSKNVVQSSHIFKAQITWAFFSAALFDLYPLHVSVISWFAAQHTILVSLFYLVSFWCYLSWRKSSSKILVISSICCFALALLTEETGATLPFVIFAYEALCISRISISANWQTTLKKTFLTTLPYWLVLAIYFFLRNLVLGTLIAKSSVLYHQRPIEIFQTWLHGLQQILVPIDVSILAQNNPTTITWEVIVISALLLSLHAFTAPNTSWDNRRLGIFLIVWFLLSLAPASNILGTYAPHLISARITYLSTIPLCIFLTRGIANFGSGFRYSPLMRTTGGAFLAIALLILYCNNQQYCYIGRRSNKIIENLQKYYQSMPGDPLVKILGLPQPNAVGIYNMPRKPFLDRDILNCNVLDIDDLYIPFGFLKESTNAREGKINFLYWDEKVQRLEPTIPYCSIPISITFPTTSYKQHWEGGELKTIIHNGEISPDKAEWENGNIFHLISNRSSSIEINLAEFPCWPINFVSFKVKIAPPSNNKSKLDYELHFLNNIVPDCSLNECCSRNTFSRIEIMPNGKEQNLIFPLRNLPDWVLGDKCRGLKLLLPPHSDIKLLAMNLPETDTIIPIVSGPSVIGLARSPNSQFIHYDASHISDCTQVALEIIGPYKLPNQYADFETVYSDQPDRNVRFNIPASTPSGTLKIVRTSFPCIGTYKVRMRALDKNGKQVGLAGDHFLINVE